MVSLTTLLNIREQLRSIIGLIDTALQQNQEISAQPQPSTPETTSLVGNRRKIAWGAKVSPTFRERIWWIADTLGLNPDDLMACIAWESGETFSASIKNAAGSGATGLIQFMPSTARNLGTTTANLAKMSPEDQLSYVYKYFRPYAGRLNNLGDIYMAILWPKGVGKPDSYVLWNKASKPTTFRQNSGLDINRDTKITRAEAVQKVQAKLVKGLKEENMA